ncbi:MAG TPA: hypothetical protein VE338_16495 [Ktedonobacterales bacterium]|nr:hypothetical protein [Ktedonobacterales bacterium]
MSVEYAADGRSRLWLRAAEITWVVVVALDMAIFMATIPSSYRSVQQPCAGAISCGAVQLSAADWSAMQAHGVTPGSYATYALAVALTLSLLLFATGYFIAWRKWNDPMALFVSAIFITYAATNVSDTLAPSPGWHGLSLGGAQFVLTALSFPALATFMLTFPTGRFTPRWAALIVLLTIIPVAVQALGAAYILAVSAVLTMWAMCILTQIYRYARVYSLHERQQTKWLVFSLAIGISLLFVTNVPPLIWPELAAPGSYYRLLGGVWLSLFWAVIPVGVGIAILRYRLYDIDLIIRRTVTYGLVTMILAGVYAGGVIGGQRALPALTGIQASNSPIFVVLSTLAVAALFQPLRRWIQRAVDRRFYRQAYDARRTLERFSVALREEVDLPTLRGRLTTVVEETLHPASVSLWLREPSRDQGSV